MVEYGIIAILAVALVCSLVALFVLKRKLTASGTNSPNDSADQPSSPAEQETVGNSQKREEEYE